MKKSVLITGANGSLGLELVKKYLDKNYNVFFHCRKNSNIKISENLRKSCFILSGDLKKKTTIKKISDLIINKKIDILINNAGMYINKAFKENTIKDIKDIFEINFFSNVYILKKIISKLKKKILIININSVAGLSGSQNESIYSASKHAMKGFYEAIDKEYFGKHVNILNIFPGAFKSKITKKRNTFNLLMTPVDLAEAIFKASKEYSSLKITNINLIRKN